MDSSDEGLSETRTMLVGVYIISIHGFSQYRIRLRNCLHLHRVLFIKDYVEASGIRTTSLRNM